MHTAEQLSLASFEASVGDKPVSAATLVPGWAKTDRFGLVVNSPLGSLKASLLTQLAIANYYAIGASADRQPGYPEIYLFHVGGAWGDHSSFDFWPPRKEVMVSTSLELLEAINDRAVTRLALPEAPPGAIAELSGGPSTWAEINSFLSRVTSSFLYAPAGVGPSFDVRIATSDPALLANARATLAPLETVSESLAALAVDPASVLPGPSVTEDLLRWASVVRARYPEVDAAFRAQLRADFEATLAQHGGRRSEPYRRLSTAEALARVAGLGAERS